METYEKKLKEVIDILYIEDLELEDKKEEDEEKEVPDYDKYTIDKNIAYMRILLIKDHILNNKLIRAKTWQEMLIKLC